MSTHNICLYGVLTKITRHLSSNTLLMCSTDMILFMSGSSAVCHDYGSSWPSIFNLKYLVSITYAHNHNDYVET